MPHWVPLESNPEVFTKYAKALGCNEKLAFCDVYGLDDELLQMIPQPVYGISLLIPSTAAKTMREKLNEKALTAKESFPPGLWYTFQTVGNACGTVAAIHILANVNPPCLSEDSPLRKFVSKTSENDPAERAKMMEVSEELASVHAVYASQGQTAAPERADDKVDEHFVAFMNVGGNLVELDGAKKGPVVHATGVTSETFIYEAAKICREYMEAAAGSLKFAVMALVDGDQL